MRDDKPLPHNIETDTQEKTKSPSKRVDRKKALAMVAGGMTQTEVAQEFGVCKQAINNLVKRAQDNKAALLSYQDNKAEVFEDIQSMLLEGVDRDKIKGATAQQLVTSAAILQDKIQVLRGQATDHTIVDIRAIQAIIKGRVMTGDTIIDAEPAC
jgi:transposase